MHTMSNKTTAKNLEARFEAGDDILDYFDLTKASRPLLKKERINLDIPHWMILRIDQVASRKGMASITVLSREAQKAAGELGSIDETRDFLEQLRAWKTA